MAWYKEGSITLEQKSKKVIGSGTKWTNPLIGICSGQMLILKTQNTIEIYEIASVQSDTELTLAKQYDGETKSGLDYAIPTAPKVSIETLALRISEMLNYYQQQMEGWQTALTGEGEVTVTAPDGRVVTIKSQYSIQKELIQLVDQSKDFAQSASKSAITATDSASVATTSSDTAKIYADNANNSAKEASQSAINSANSAKSANTSEVNAKSSEIAAKNSADNAKEWVSTIDPQAIVRYCGDLDDIPPNHLGALSKGIYYQKQDAKARLELGYPVQEAGSLIILPTLTEGNQSCVQIYTLYKSGRQFIRNFRGSTEDGFWENWVEQITTANISADIARALPATKSVVNGVPTYKVGDHVVFKDAIGEFRLMPFRAGELPFGWYFRNGDNYLLSSPQGRALNGLSANYKRDHQIAIKNINGQQYINVPSAFAPDGRGYFERPANGTTRQVGSAEDDAIRDIWGHIDTGVVANHHEYTRGAFCGTYAIHPKNGGFQPTKEWDAWGFDFYASRVVPTAHENRPINMGLTPVIYLGV